MLANKIILIGLMGRLDTSSLDRKENDPTGNKRNFDAQVIDDKTNPNPQKKKKEKNCPELCIG